MSITRFFVDAFTSALEQKLATEADLLRHMTPEVLAEHLPRPLWARLLTACLGASRVDAATVVDTVGIPNLCEHLPDPLLWTCLAEIAATALGAAATVAPSARAGTADPAAAPDAPAPATTSGARRVATDMLLPPPPASAPRPGSASDGAGATDPASLFDGARQRATTRSPTRTLSGRVPAAGASTRRPQAAAPPPPATIPSGTPVGAPPRATSPSPLFSPPPRADELDFEIETDIRSDWKDRDAIPVDDEQLVDWSSSEETIGGTMLDRPKR
ncbi:MAG: hypothetical protein R3B48_07140 [Kofleriaceae bacterium]